VAAIKELVEGWDLEMTESLLKKLESEKERIREMERQKREAETSKYVIIGAQIWCIRRKKIIIIFISLAWTTTSTECYLIVSNNRL